MQELTNDSIEIIAYATLIVLVIVSIVFAMINRRKRDKPFNRPVVNTWDLRDEHFNSN